MKKKYEVFVPSKRSFEFVTTTFKVTTIASVYEI